ncbi:aldo/keto reductase [Paenibacillus sp. CMAA1739]|uniref:aldo/keto reductase n=1 Tax=Paenibacillus ottowii TaxID=2315729 RepID=UPI0027317A65|nr:MULTISPECIES: aldo/keto reductase [Paenibacillus]MDP1513376.1 aldo/keto reductase [Paenibacillus ottowii]MEC4569426.1 aldo/keto reductase [Paenibacillus sp. CMAA1739]
MTLSNTTRSRIGMPIVGFGTYQLSNDQEEFSVREANSAGFRHIDSSEIYRNEEGTGRGIKAAGVSREQIFVTTKLYPVSGTSEITSKNYKQTMDTLKNQLIQLQLDYVDLYLIHAPLSELRLEQWTALEELKKLGLAKHIGVSNYNISTIKEIFDAGLTAPEANQIEFHPLCTQVELTSYMSENSIAPIAYSSLAPLSTLRTGKEQGGDIFTDAKKECQLIRKEIADKLHVSEAKVLLRWALQRGYGILSRSSKAERIRENLDLFDFEISNSDMDLLNSLNQNQQLA